MSKRSDIIDGRDASAAKYGIVYTEVLGWVDLGHAQGTDIRELLRLMSQGESSKNEFYDVRYAQGMTSPFGLLRSGKVMTWRIRKGRPYWEKKSIALAMMMAMARKFEAFQGVFPSNLETFQPLLFPDPEKFPHTRPRKGVLPPFMRTVVPYNDFLCGNVILPQHDGTFVIPGANNGRMGL